MNDFSYLTDDVVGRLATVSMEEIFEKTVDDNTLLKETNQHDKGTV